MDLNMRHGTSNNRRNRNRNNNTNNSGRHNNNQNSRTKVYDSNGPDVRIRGTAHQVAEKYLTLAKDATSMGDRMVAENYFQHAEHYIRIINELSGDARDKVRGLPNSKPVADDEGNKISDDLALPASIIGAEVSEKPKETQKSESVD